MQDFWTINSMKHKIPQNDHTFAAGLIPPQNMGPIAWPPLAQGSRSLNSNWSFGKIGGGAVVNLRPPDCHSFCWQNQQNSKTIGGIIAAHPNGQIPQRDQSGPEIPGGFCRKKIWDGCVFFWGILWPGLYGLPGRIPGPGKKTRISWRVCKKHHEIKVPWTATFHSVFPPKMWHARADWVLWIVFETCLTGQPPSTESKDTTRDLLWLGEATGDLILKKHPMGASVKHVRIASGLKQRVINYQ